LSSKRLSLVGGILEENRAIWQSPLRRLLILKWVICTALLAGLAISPRLWITDRAFPTVPAFSELPELPNWLCLALSCAMALFVALAALLPRPRLLLLAIPTCGAILVLFDMNRLQPWFYQYLLMILALGLVRWDLSDDRYAKQALAICGVILGFLYIWSGIQKANPAFAANVFPWLLEPLSKVVGEAATRQLATSAIVVPVFETLIGILLIVPWTRTMGLFGAVGMHLLLLFLLGPFGHDYNSVIWPWNLAMLAMALVIFFGNEEPVLRPAWSPMLGKAVIVLVGFLPILSFFERWDNYTSASLYSGRTRDGWIMLSEPAANRLAEMLTPAENSRLDQVFDGYSLDASSWSMAELNVPLYPEKRVYEGIAQKLRMIAMSHDDVTLLVTERPSLFHEEDAESEEVSLR
jgi:hypothetical protein